MEITVDDNLISDLSPVDQTDQSKLSSPVFENPFVDLIKDNNKLNTSISDNSAPNFVIYS